jgi:periplasmic divalent cation tolerance protein
MYIVIFITCSNKQEAGKISEQLVKNKLVACVNIVGAVESVFWWRGKVDQANEVLLIAKSKRTKLARIARLVKSIHSYEVPEIIALPIIGGYRPYLDWIDESVR